MDSKTFWLTLGPVLVINTYFITMLIIFPLIYPKLPKLEMIENRHHSKILGKWIRYWWIWITKPLFNFFIKFKFTPNQISFLGTLMSFIAGAIFAFGDRWLEAGTLGAGGWFMVIGGSLDFMDGRLARETGQESLAGAFFDSVMDRVAECAVMAGLAWHFRDSWYLWLVMFAFAGSMLTSYSKCRGDKMGVEFGGGMMQRPERVVYIGVGAIFAPVLGVLFNKFFPETFSTIVQGAEAFYLFPLLMVAVFSNFTTYVRISNIMRLLDEKEASMKS